MNKKVWKLGKEHISKECQCTRTWLETKDGKEIEGNTYIIPCALHYRKMTEKMVNGSLGEKI